jgi:hypothetical protein
MKIRGDSRLPPQYVDRGASMCCSWTSDSYSACSPFGSVLGRNHTDTWAGCIVSPTTPTRPLPSNLMLMVLVSWGGGEVYPSTSTSTPGHGYFGGGSSIPLHTTRRSSLIPSDLVMTPP